MTSRDIYNKIYGKNFKLKLSDFKFESPKISNKEITDEIVNNITYDDFDGLTSQQSKQLNLVMRETLRRARMIDSTCEIALGYDLNGFVNQKGEWIQEVCGTRDSIILESDTDMNHILRSHEGKYIVIVSHNHPGNHIVSIIDFFKLINYDNMKAIVAVTNSGNFSYLMKTDFKYNNYQEERTRIYNKYNNFEGYDTDTKYNTLLIELLNNCSSFGIEFFREVKLK